MAVRRAIELARQAFELDEIVAFLSGKKDYAVPISRFVSASVPTDFEIIVQMGIFKYFNESNDEDIPKKYLTAIEQLLNGDCVDVWCAYMVCIQQVRFEIQRKSPFVIMSKELIHKVSSAIKQNKGALETCQLWQGYGRERGLLQDVERSNSVLSNKYGVSFL